MTHDKLLKKVINTFTGRSKRNKTKVWLRCLYDIRPGIGLILWPVYSMGL